MRRLLRSGSIRLELLPYRRLTARPLDHPAAVGKISVDSSATGMKAIGPIHARSGVFPSGVGGQQGLHGDYPPSPPQPDYRLIVKLPSSSAGSRAAGRSRSALSLITRRA